MFRSRFQTSCRQAANLNELLVASPECLQTHYIRPWSHHFIWLRQRQTPRDGGGVGQGRPSNVQNTKLCCAFFPTGLHPYARMRYSGYLLRDRKVTSLITEGGGGGGNPTGCLRHCCQVGLVSEMSSSARWHPLSHAKFILFTILSESTTFPQLQCYIC